MAYIIFGVLCVLIGLYPLSYLFTEGHVGLLSTKSSELLSNTLWNVGFYSHIFLSGLALLVGWTQFNKKWRTEKVQIHRTIGKVYVITAILGSITGTYIGYYATGGIVSISGFMILGIIWFYTSLKAYLHIRKGDVLAHQKMMIYSYAACFAAVMLRIWLPILVIIFGGFNGAYQTVAWLCWVPNLIVAWMIVRNLPKSNNTSSPAFN